jgi:hypothetical protein
MNLELDDIESIKELRKLTYSDINLMSLVLDEDDLQSLDELRNLLNTPTVSSNSINWIGDFEYEPKSSNFELLSIYRNNPLKTVFINTQNGWKVLVKDGQKGDKGDANKFVSGGGLGLKDVVTLIDQKLSAYSPGTSGSTFDGSISANNVLVNTTTFSTLSGTSAQDLFEQIDHKIASKILLGLYQTNDIIETNNATDDVYIGKSKSSGEWYFRRVSTVSEELIEIRHANISNNPSFLTYESALNSYSSLDYRLLNEIII